ncbi:hypothetical protein CDAR_428861 [Caerostris darwini]|uniref:Uncharacterized protein n=1 Tax=Caerostris darwini TaxID=1538125 RepID=A0AAV4V525_9ARAC|nr:hypothetical protein CDAR_428861 [Caerostris darwini]
MLSISYFPLQGQTLVPFVPEWNKMEIGNKHRSTYYLFSFEKAIPMTEDVTRRGSINGWRTISANDTTISLSLNNPRIWRAHSSTPPLLSTALHS